MKKTFDWLRGAILEKAFKIYDGTITVDIHDVGKLINEAEAKCSDIEQDAYERGYVLGFDNGYKDGQRFEKAKWESEFVSIGTYKQVAKERDIAIEQLHELGYEFGEKIRKED